MKDIKTQWRYCEHPKVEERPYWKLNSVHQQTRKKEAIQVFGEEKKKKEKLEQVATRKRARSRWTWARWETRRAVRILRPSIAGQLFVSQQLVNISLYTYNINFCGASFILHFQGFCWEPEHVPNSEDWCGENLPKVRQDRWHIYAQGDSKLSFNDQWMCFKFKFKLFRINIQIQNYDVKRIE